jgi:hypothetical protein
VQDLRLFCSARLQTVQVLKLSPLEAQAQVSWFVCCVLQPLMQRKLLATQAHQVRVYVPPTLLHSAFGDAWQQAGFKVQLSVHKDSARIAGRRVAASKHLVLLINCMNNHHNWFILYSVPEFRLLPLLHA